MQHVQRHFKRADPVLYSAIAGTAWTKLKRRHGRFPALCRIIIGQQVSIKAADAIYGRFTALFPRKQPRAEILLTLPDRELRDAGLSAAKCAAVRDLALRVEDGTLPLHRLHVYSEAELVEKLAEVRGIGRWSAEMFMIFTLGREDVFSPGDLGLRNAIHRLYNLPAVPTPTEAEAFALRWAPYRSYACRILWNSLQNTPVERNGQQSSGTRSRSNNPKARAKKEVP